MTNQVAAGTKLLIREKGLTRRAECVKMNKNSISVRYEGETGNHSVALSAVQIAKKRSLKRIYLPKAEQLAKTRRLDRHRKVHVVPVRFRMNETYGNFALMLDDNQYKKHGIMLYNDNSIDWEEHGRNPTRPMRAGGGNACARPAQHLGHSIGMPTGPFHSLDQRLPISLGSNMDAKEVSAKEIIDEAINRIVRLFLKNKDKDTLYFSVNPNDPPDSRRLGLAIFAGAVGHDVIDYISQRIDGIPALVQKARVQGLIV